MPKNVITVLDEAGDALNFRTWTPLIFHCSLIMLRLKWSISTSIFWRNWFAQATCCPDGDTDEMYPGSPKCIQDRDQYPPPGKVCHPWDQHPLLMKKENRIIARFYWTICNISPDIQNAEIHMCRMMEKRDDLILHKIRVFSNTHHPYSVRLQIIEKRIIK